MGILSDTLEPALEFCMRQVYWRVPMLQQAIEKRRKKNQTGIVKKLLTETQLREALDKVGFAKRSPITMVHSSTTHWQLRKDDRSEPMNVLQTAARTLEILLEMNEERGGTLVMPTNPFYKTPYSPFVSTKEIKEVYDPKRTPTNIGLINEFFRNTPGVKRSLHPYSTVACIGPRADDILEGNLSGENPYPHGKTSAFYRIYKENGMVMSLGMPLAHYMTIMHVAEDTCPDVFPDSFYRDRSFSIVTENGPEDWVVRQRHPAANRCFCEKAYVRLFLRKKILHKETYQGVHLDWVMAQPFVDTLFEYRKRRNTFPHFLLSLMGPCI